MRDLLAVDINVRALLPADDSSYGFDNIAGVLKVSPAADGAYLSAARKISRSAVGVPRSPRRGRIYRVSPELQQHDQRRPAVRHARWPLVRACFPLDARLRRFGQRRPRRDRRRRRSKSCSTARVCGSSPCGRHPLASTPSSPVSLRLPVSGGPHEIGVSVLQGARRASSSSREPFQNPDARPR